MKASKVTDNVFLKLCFRSKGIVFTVFLHHTDIFTSYIYISHLEFYVNV